MKTGSSFLVLLFGLAFFAFGSLFLAVIGYVFLSTLDTYRWARVPAAIRSIEVDFPGKAPSSSKGDVFELKVVYDYTYEGQNLTGASYRKRPYRHDSYERLVDEKVELIQNEWRHAFVNPRNPQEAILRRDSLWTVFLLLFPVPFVGVGLACIAGYFGFTWPQGESTSRRTTSSRKSKKQLAPLGGLVFLMAGSAMLYFLCLAPWLRSYAAKQWVEVPCKVLWSRVQRHQGDESDTYSADIFYEYEFDGQTHRSNRYSFSVVNSSGSKRKRKIVRQYPPGVQGTCFVNPESPHHAVLTRTPPWGSMGLVGGIGLVFSIAGIVIMRTSGSPVSG